MVGVITGELPMPELRRHPGAGDGPLRVLRPGGDHLERWLLKTKGLA